MRTPFNYSFHFICLNFFCFFFHSTALAKPWILGYHVGYQRDFFQEEHIEHLTHIAIGRAFPNTDGSINTAFDIDKKAGPEWAKDMVKIAKKKGIVTLGFLGGSTGSESSADGLQMHERWSAACKDIPKFAQNLVAFAEEFGFDGLDLNWEPIKDSELPILISLAQHIRKISPKLVLSYPLNWLNPNIDKLSPLWPKVAAAFDKLNIMSYMMTTNSFGWKSWHSSALQGEKNTTPTSVNSSVQMYLKAKIPTSKLGVGAAYEGQCFSGIGNNPSEELSGFKFEGGDTWLPQRKISAFYKASLKNPNGMKYNFDSIARVPYLSSKNAVGPNTNRTYDGSFEQLYKCNYITYEDEASLKEKAEYVKKKKLGGIIIWTLAQGEVSLTKTLADVLK